MSAGTPPTRVKSASWTGMQRVTLGPDSLLAEARDPITGVWTPSRQLFYDEIHAVYTYRTNDWGYFLVALVYALLGGVALLAVGWSSHASARGWAIGGALLALAVGVLAVYRIFVRQRPVVRLQASGGTVVFATRDAGFLAELETRLTPAATDGSASASATEATAPPAPDAARPPQAESSTTPGAPVPEAEVATPVLARADTARWAWQPGGETAAADAATAAERSDNGQSSAGIDPESQPSQAR